MKISEGFKLNSWERIKQFLLIILIIGVLVTSIFGIDRLSWERAINLIKQQVPIEANYALYDGGGGSITDYHPFRWKGDLKGETWFFTDKDFNINMRKIAWDYNGIQITSIGRLQFGMPGYNFPIIYPENMEIHTLIYTSEKYLDENRRVCYRKIPHNFDMWLYILDEGKLSQLNTLQKPYFRENAVLGIIYKIDNQVYVQIHKTAYWRSCKGGGFYWSFWKN